MPVRNVKLTVGIIGVHKCFRSDLLTFIKNATFYFDKHQFVTVKFA